MRSASANLEIFFELLNSVQNSCVDNMYIFAIKIGRCGKMSPIGQRTNNRGMSRAIPTESNDRLDYDTEFAF